MAKKVKPVEQKQWTPAELATMDPAYWATLCKIKLQSGEFSFEGHEYQIEPMQSTAKRFCAMKGTQGGWTELEVLKVLHGMIHKCYPSGVLYMFPTTDTVREFSKSRFQPLIESNYEFIGQYVKQGGQGTDTTSLKKIHTAFLYLRGARLSQRIGVGITEGQSALLRGIPVDRVVFDEVDLMADEVVAKAKSRMGHSAVQEESYVSNPTLPESGIHKLFLRSDQRYFFNKCDACNTYTCAALEFPECVRLREDGTGYVACKKCGKELIQRSVGEWVASIRDNTEYMHGYQWSQLNSMFNDPGQILAEYNDPPQGNLADVYRLRLGMPYVATEDKLTLPNVYSCCNNDAMCTGSRGPCAMGVDVGKIKHVVIGVCTGRDRFQILKVARLSSWEDIHDIAKRFGVTSCVIDIRPYEDEARRFQAAERYRIYLCEYSENPMQDAIWNNKDKTVRAYRTGVFDKTHKMFTQDEVELPRRCPEMEVFARQVCSATKVLVTNQRTGTSVYRYRTVGNDGDHYRNAMNYFSLAASGHRLPRVNATMNQAKYALNEVVKI